MTQSKVLTIAVCLNYPPQSMAMGLYLPDDVYDENIPVFVRQETSSALLNMLNSKKKDEAIHKYSHVFLLECWTTVTTWTKKPEGGTNHQLYIRFQE